MTDNEWTACIDDGEDHIMVIEMDEEKTQNSLELYVCNKLYIIVINCKP